MRYRERSIASTTVPHRSGLAVRSVASRNTRSARNWPTRRPMRCRPFWIPAATARSSWGIADKGVVVEGLPALPGLPCWSLGNMRTHRSAPRSPDRVPDRAEHDYPVWRLDHGQLPVGHAANTAAAQPGARKPRRVIPSVASRGCHQCQTTGPILLAKPALTWSLPLGKRHRTIV